MHVNYKKRERKKGNKMACNGIRCNGTSCSLRTNSSTEITMQQNYIHFLFQTAVVLRQISNTVHAVFKNSVKLLSALSELCNILYFMTVKTCHLQSHNKDPCAVVAAAVKTTVKRNLLSQLKLQWPIRNLAGQMPPPF